jgi:tRNA-dihydrouridine synthase 2
LTKFCVNQFKGTRLRLKKAETQKLHQRLSAAKDYTAMEDLIGSGTGEEEFREIVQAVLSRLSQYHNAMIFTTGVPDQEEEVMLSTPPERENPEPPSLDAPLGPTHLLRMTIPAGVSGRDPPTPTPGGGISLAAI